MLRPIFDKAADALSQEFPVSVVPNEKMEGTRGRGEGGGSQDVLNVKLC